MTAVKFFLKKHKINLIIGVFLIFTALLATNSILPKADDNKNVSIYLEPWGENNIVVDQTVQVDVNVNADLPINAAGATIDFPQDKMELIAISKERSFFDLWTDQTVISEETGEIHFGGGTYVKGGHIGPGTILTLTFKAKDPGEANLVFKNAQVLASDGKGTDVLNRIVNLTYSIREETQEKQPPSADLNDDGKINMTDFSIMTVAMFKKYDSAYDLNMDGKVDISDLSNILSQIF